MSRGICVVKVQDRVQQQTEQGKNLCEGSTSDLAPKPANNLRGFPSFRFHPFLFSVLLAHRQTQRRQAKVWFQKVKWPRIYPQQLLHCFSMPANTVEQLKPWPCTWCYRVICMKSCRLTAQASAQTNTTQPHSCQTGQDAYGSRPRMHTSGLQLPTGLIN